MKDEKTPREIVEYLERYIVGQDEAKRAVAIAVRNRVRRQMLSDDLRDEVIPKNILMIGPTGVGKTEIARRLSNMTKAPFLKVEASKFTEVGYVGRDVESIIRDLVDTGYRMVEKEAMKQVQDEAERRAEERLLDILAPPPSQGQGQQNWMQMFQPPEQMEEPQVGEGPTRQELQRKEREQAQRVREFTRQRLEAGELEDEEIEIEVEQSQMQSFQLFSPAGMEEMGIDMQDLLGNLMPSQTVTKKTTVAEARSLLTRQEAERLIDPNEVGRKAVERVENDGIVFLDEMDKIAGREGGHGPEVSREGVQRDILPIVEGSTVMTKYGPVSTDHILFIAAGAFHVTKPSDMIPELQGRFPIRVELNSLSKADFERILQEPESSLVKQYTALLETEGVEIEFTDDAIAEIADLAQQVNERTENIGARRLYTLVERLLEELSFIAPEISGQKINIDREYVQEQLHDVVEDTDLSRYML
ncbi:MAG: ATP-dependent protease ATPase subunit HslU [Armatimonadota bacterium]